MDTVIVSREDWGALNPVARNWVTQPLENVIYSYTSSDTPQCYSEEECKATMAKLQRSHLYDLHMTDIAYNFVIAGDGRIYEGRGWGVYPSQFRKIAYMTKKAYLIGVLGDLKDRPSEKVWAATWNVLRIGYENNRMITKVFFSAEDKFDSQIFRKLENNSENILGERLSVDKVTADLKPTIELKRFRKHYSIR